MNPTHLRYDAHTSETIAPEIQLGVPIERRIPGVCPEPRCGQPSESVETIIYAEKAGDVFHRRESNGLFARRSYSGCQPCPTCQAWRDLAGAMPWREVSRGPSVGTIAARIRSLMEMGGPLDLVRAAAFDEMVRFLDPDGWASLAELRAHRAYHLAADVVESLPVDCHHEYLFPLGVIRFNALPGGMIAGQDAPSPGHCWSAIDAHAVGSWGQVDPEAAAANDRAVRERLSVVRSRHTVGSSGRRPLVVEVTTFLHPRRPAETYAVGRLDLGTTPAGTRPDGPARYHAPRDPA